MITEDIVYISILIVRETLTIFVNAHLITSQEGR